MDKQDRFKHKASINLREADCFKDWKSRLKTWIILTDEYGKPSDKYIEDFINNFYKLINSGNWCISSESEFNEHFDNVKYQWCGGFEFYKNLSNARGYTEEALKEYIQNYEYSPLELRYTEEIEDMGAKYADKLSISMSCKIKGSARGGFEGDLTFDADALMWTLHKGAKLPEYATNSYIAYIKQSVQDKVNKITSDRILTEDLVDESVQLLADIACLSHCGLDYVYIENSHKRLKDVMRSDDDISKVIASEAKDAESVNIPNKSITVETENNNQFSNIGMLKHNIALQISSKLSNGDCNTVIEFDSQTMQYSIIIGSTVCRNFETKKKKDRLSEPDQTYVVDFVTQGYFNSNGEVIKTITVDSLIKALKIATLSNINCEDRLLVKGTEITLKDCLNDAWLYEQIIVRGLFNE